MALSRAAGLCRLALRTHWSSVRLLSSVAVSGEPLADASKPGRHIDREALRRERALRPPAERKQSAPPRKTYSSAKPTPEQVQLNRDIGACASAEAVLDLATARPALLNGVVVPTALMTIAKVVGKGEPAQWLESDARLQQLLAAAVPLMEREGVDAHGFANLLYACGQLGIVPSSSWLDVFWGASFTALHDFVPQGLSNTMYACGQLLIKPPAEWLQRFWDAGAPKLDGFKPQAMSNTIYGCGQLGITPPADWLQQYWRASSLKLGAFIAQDYSNTLYACGQLSIIPPTDWLQRYFYASGFKLGAFNPQNFSNTMYACGQLGLVPPTDWLQRFWDASALKLGEFVPQALSNTLYACGQLGVMPIDSWLLRYWHASASKMGGFSPQNLANTMYACGQLGIALPVDWLQHYWLASALKLGDFKPQNFSNTLHACGKSNITPPAGWLQRFWHASALKLGGFKPQELSNTLYACGQLGITPPADWLQRYWHASAFKLGEFNPQAFSNVVLVCAQLDIRPPVAWLQSFSDAFEHSLLDTDRQSLANTALALATLGLWELPLWPSLWERLCNSLSCNTADWNADIELSQLYAQQLYQTYQAAEVERPGLLKSPSPELLAAARKSWFDGMDHTSSRLHADVSACLARMSVAHVNERWCERSERCIDIAIEGAGAPVAVEVDGPHHYLQDGRQDGRTRLRNRMLAAHGWRVVVVHFRVWMELTTEAQREDYLHNLLP